MHATTTSNSSATTASSTNITKANCNNVELSGNFEGNVGLNQNILCICRFSTGRISKISRKRFKVLSWNYLCMTRGF